MVRRFYTQYATTPADNQEHVQTMNTDDNFRLQHLKKVWAGLATPGVYLTFRVANSVIGIVDLARFAAGNSDVLLEKDINPNIPLKIGITDTTSTGVNNLPLMMEYDIDSDT